MLGLKPKNLLDTLLPYAMIATRKWLSAKGIGRHSLDNALKSKKLDALAVGVYARPGMSVPWEGMVSSLQRMSVTPVHVGGITALELQGFGHYLSSSKEKTIHLYSETRLPAWFGKLKRTGVFRWHGTKTIWPAELLVEKKIVREYLWRDDLPPLIVSCPEKACLEMLMDVPASVSFEHADELMQGLTSLSPRKLEVLLGACRNVKVKRLFFWLAERQGYFWVKKLDHTDFDLGKGKRVVAKGGRLDNKYLITVPEHLYGSK
jgi:Transcriptional regulator, AbiEi antitoxin, Type IV TA system/Transcriptional regulator, AbiEi antitoxin N-terminal domain